MEQRETSRGRLEGINTLKALALNPNLTYPERISAQALIFTMAMDDANRDAVFNALSEIAAKAPNPNERLCAQDLLSKVIATDRLR